MTDLNTQILIEIRDAITSTRTELSARIDESNERLETLGSSLGSRIDQTNARLDQTNARLDQTNARLDQTNTRLDKGERRHVESEVRLLTELVAVRGAVTDVATLLREDVSLRDDVGELRARVERLEAKDH